jgi:von Willebrand factor type A domain
LLFWPRGRGSAFRLIASNAVGFVLFLLLASHPAAAAADEFRVIAVHTASAPRVSMVVEPPVAPPQNGSAAESCTVTIDGKPVATTVSPMASGDLSVALVIDTASGLTSQELAAVQSGATEFLLRLPEGAHTMVVTAAGQPEVVAPLSEHRAEALSAISALRVGDSPATMAATMLAAQSLQSAPPGPRAIIVYTQGRDEQGALADRLRLSRAVLNSEAVLNVIQTGTDILWPSVVDQAGGGVVTTNAEDVVQSFGDLAATLGDQYLVAFEAPGELPAVAQVAFQTGDQEYRTVVNLPAQAAPTESSEGPPDRRVPWLVASLVAGLVLTALGVFVRRARQLRHADGGEPSTRVASPATGAPPPVKAASASPPPQTAAAGNAPLPEQAASSSPTPDDAAPSAPVPAQAAPSTPPPKQPAVPTASLSDDAAQNDPPLRPPTSPVESRPARRSLSAAIEGRRLARLILDSQPELQPEPAEQRGQAANNQAEDPLADQQARYPAEGRSTASGSEAGTKTESGRPENPAEGDPS